jgi:uncharacterized protein (DUF885 family)
VNAAGTEASRFDDIARAYYQAWFRYRPEAAVEAGIAGYAHLLTPCADEDIGALVCLNDELRVGLEELDHKALDPDRALDYELMYSAARLENQRLLDLEPRQPDPAKWLPVNAVYQLLIRPVENFEDALLARLRSIPAHLDAARAPLRLKAKGIPPLWLQTTITEARRGAEFLADLPKHPKLAGPRVAHATLDEAWRRAARALEDYAGFLEHDLAHVAQGDFACGGDYFGQLLRRRHFLEVSTGSLYELGQELVERTRRELSDASEELTGSRDIARAVRAIQSHHPSTAGLLDVYRRQMRAAREFLAARDLVTLPAVERLDVIETPIFLRHQIPFAAYREPAPNDPAQQGYYYVTPPRDEEQLREHDHAGLMHTCVHEAWPGHHLQFVTANLNSVAHTLPRLLNSSATFYEGWALYGEQLMHEQGFLNRPGQRLILLRDRLWRALRILLDIEIHTRGLSLERAADRMVELLVFPRSQALADLTWYTRAPTVPSGYATGWTLINALRTRMSVESERKSSLKNFHDRLLSAGSVALPLAIRRVFGEEIWSDVKRTVFGEAVNEAA